MTRFSPIAACLLAAVLAAATPSRAANQPAGPAPSLSPRAQHLTCGPRVSGAPGGAARVRGSLDRTAQAMFGPGDAVVVDTGDATAMAAGQLYVAYRHTRAFGWDRHRYSDASVQNAGVLRVESVSAGMAVARVVWACDGVDVGDALAPFVPPLAAGPAEGDAPAAFDLGAPVLFGGHKRRLAAERDLLLVERAVGQTVTSGQAVTFFRRPYGADHGVAVVGAGTVQAVDDRTFLVEVAHSRDAVEAGDLVAVGTAPR